MSYYYSHIIECDQLAFDRMLEAWKHKSSADWCVLGRPDYVWVLSGEMDTGSKGVTYLLFGIFNHGPTIWDAIDWLTDDLGIGIVHFSIWTKGEDADEWDRGGTYVPEGEVPIQTVFLDYDEKSDKLEDAPDGYKSYKYCDIAVNPDIWTEVTMDYTREEGPHYPSPVEEALTRIDENLSEIRSILEYLASRTED